MDLRGERGLVEGVDQAGVGCVRERPGQDLSDEEERQVNTALETAIGGLIASNLSLAGLLAWKWVPRRAAPRQPAPSAPVTPPAGGA